MCQEMRIDCEDMLNNRGIVKNRPVMMNITSLTPFAKGRVLESSIPDNKGEPIKITLVSRMNTAKSEIDIGIGDDWHYKPFLSLKGDHGNIEFFKSTGSARAGLIKYTRRAGIQDARKWKEVVDALKQQGQ